jgi:hypothetical protein
MTRRTWIASGAALASCGRRGAPMDVFPETIGPWKRVSSRELPISESQDPLPRSSVARAQVASYEGPGKLEARAYELSTPGAGLDVAQRWHPSADTVFFWARRYFVVVKWDEADRKALQEFTRDLEKRLNGSEPRP